MCDFFYFCTMKQILLFVIIVCSLQACEERDIKIPKQRGYFRIDLPERNYQQFSEKGFPYSFQIPALPDPSRRAVSGASALPLRSCPQAANPRHRSHPGSASGPPHAPSASGCRKARCRNSRPSTGETTARRIPPGLR